MITLNILYFTLKHVTLENNIEHNKIVNQFDIFTTFCSLKKLTSEKMLLKIKIVIQLDIYEPIVT